MSIGSLNPAEKAAEYLRDRIQISPDVVLILGSGLGVLGDQITAPVAIPYAEIPGFASSTVSGHAGRLVAGTLEDVNVIAFQGRFHAYEGHEPSVLATPLRTAHLLGAETLLVSCAAGGVNPELKPGTLLVLSDHLNLMGINPLTGPVVAGETRFPDMSQPYDLDLRRLAHQAARDEDIELAEGVYAAMLGPSYETPAEIRMLSTLGADAVGMSTVPETLVARALGMRVLGLALITNAGAGIGMTTLNHAEVLDEGARSGERFIRLIRNILSQL